MRKKLRFGFLVLISFFVVFLGGCEYLNNLPSDETQVIEIKSISIDQTSVLEAYIAGEVDISNISIVLHKEDDSTTKISLTESMLSATDLALLLVPGTHTITVTYLEFTATFQITILESIPNPNQIMISFVTNGGNVIAPIHIDEGTKPTNYPIPDRVGYEFKGWYLDSNFESIVTNDTLYNQSTILYALWELKAFHVYYITNTDEEIDTAEVYYQDPLVLPTLSIPEGKMFDGWFLDADFSSPFNLSFMPGYDLYLYAKWIDETVVITFMTNGGLPIDDLVVVKGSQLESIESPVREGHEFKGWFYDYDFTQPYHKDDKIEQYIVLYAKWDIDQTATFSLKYYLIDEIEFEKMYVSLANSYSETRVFLQSKDNRVFAFGNNNTGELGDGSSTSTKDIIEITHMFNLEIDEYIVKIAAGSTFTIAYSNLNRVFAWGVNTSGQLTNEVKTPYTTSPVDISKAFSFDILEDIVDIAAGRISAYLITSTGRVFSWGDNTFGSLGDGTTSSSSTPKEIQNHFNLNQNEYLVSIKSGNGHVIAYSNQNRVFSWGQNTEGQLGIGSLVNSNMIIDITQQFGLAANEHIVAIGTGTNNSFVATSRGRLFGFGRNLGEFGTGNLNNQQIPLLLAMPYNILGDIIVSIDSGFSHKMFVTESGRIFTSGNLDSGKLGDGKKYPMMYEYSRSIFEITDQFNLSKNESIVMVGAKGSNSYALSSSGRLYAWGNIEQGLIPNTIIQNEVPKNVTRQFNLKEGESIIMMEASDLAEQHYLALTSNHRVLAWGDNAYFQLGFDLGKSYVETPTDITFYLNLNQNEHVISIATGALTSYVLTNLGRVISFGYGLQGQTGINIRQNTVPPTDITGFFELNPGDKIVKINAVSNVAYAISEQGDLYGFGFNGYGLLGDDTMVDQLKPIRLTSHFTLSQGEKIRDIYLSSTSRYVVTTHNRLFVWGNNSHYELGFNNQTTYVTPVFNYHLQLEEEETIISIFPGYYSAMILTSKHRVLAIGNNTAASITVTPFTEKYQVPTDVTTYFNLNPNENVVSINLGYLHTIVHTSLGRILSFGHQDQNGIGKPFSATHSNNTVYDITNNFVSDNNHVSNLFGKLYSHFVVTDDYRIYSWGNNPVGQLANGLTDIIYSPRLVSYYDKVLYKEVNYHINQSISLEFLLIDSIYYDGWYKDIHMDEKFTDMIMSAHDISIYAKKADQFNIYYHILSTIDVETMVSSRFLNYTFILTKDHRVFAWGSAQNGMFGIGQNGKSTIPIEITQNFYLSDDEYIVKISGGWSHVLALTNHGNVYAFGSNDRGQLGYEIKQNIYSIYDFNNRNFYSVLSTTTNANLISLITNEFNLAADEVFTDIYAYERVSYLITNHGRTFAFGEVKLPNGDITGYEGIEINELFDINQGEGILSIHEGLGFKVILTTDYRVLTYGRNDFGQLGIGNTTTQTMVFDITNHFELEEDDYITDIYVDAYSILAISFKQKVFVWGANTTYQLGITGSSKLTPYDITSNFGFDEDEFILSIAYQASKAILVTNKHRVFTFGSNTGGALGIGSITTRETITEITEKYLVYNKKIIHVAIAGGYVFAVSEDGSIFVTGGDQHNALGFGASAYISSPKLYQLREFVPIKVETYLMNDPISLMDLGYETGFRGWYLDTQLAHRFNPNNQVIDHTNLYAKYNITIDFVTNTDTEIEPMEYSYGTSQLELPQLVKEGYLFAGWYTDAEMTKRVDEITQSQTLYAKFILGSAEDLVYTEGLRIRFINGSYHVVSYYGDENVKDVIVPKIYNDGVFGYGYVTHISDSVFYYTNLDSITLPDTIDSIGAYAFSSIPFTTSIYFLGNPPKNLDPLAFYYSGATLYRMPEQEGWPTNYYAGLALMVVGEIEPLNPDFRSQIELWNEAAYYYADLIYSDSSIDWTKLLYTKDQVHIDELTLLSHSITEGLTTQSEKAYAIFNWVANNIIYSYDHGYITAYDAYLYRRGVCHQYAILMNELLRIQNIPSLYVSGYVTQGVHNFDTLFGSDEGGLETTLGHAVNFVYADGNWIILDATWNIYNMSFEDFNDYFYTTRVEGKMYYIDGMDLTLVNGIYDYQGDLIRIYEGIKATTYGYSITFNQVLPFMFRTNKDTEIGISDPFNHGGFVRNDWIIDGDTTYYARFDGLLYYDVTVLIDGYLCTFDELGKLIQKEEVIEDVNPLSFIWNQVFEQSVFFEQN